MSCTGPWAKVAILIASAAVHLTSVAAAEVTASVGPVSGTPGGATIAWITLENATGITGGNVSLRVPHFVAPGLARTTEASSGFLLASTARPGQIDLAIASPTGLTVDQGAIVSVPLSIAPTAEPGDYLLTFEGLQLYDAAPSPVANQTIAGTLTVMPRPADHDGDGLPDAWEEDYFGNTDRTGAADSDHDGLSDEREFIAGTDPTRPESVFAIEYVVVQPGEGVVTLRWTAQEGRVYEIDWSDEPLGPDMTWRPVYQPDIATDASSAQWIDDGSRTYQLPSVSYQRFYRIRASQ